MRLQKFLSRAGVASRRASEDLIRQGRVRVDGEVVTELGSRVEPETSRVEVDGRRVVLSPLRWIALHKPVGVLTSRGDPRGRRTVYDLLPEEEAELFHVGRLDYMSEGLLLFTNEGDVANRLLHPSRRVPRRYEITVDEPVARDLAARLLEGVRLEDGRAAASAATVLPATVEGERRLLLTLREGRNREIRRMLGALDVTILRLVRTAYGPVELGDLPTGRHRELGSAEVEALRAAADGPEGSGGES